MVARRGPDHRVAHHLGVYVEESRRVLLVRPAVVGVVSEQQPDIGEVAARETEVRVAHISRVRAPLSGDGALARVTDHPHADRWARSRRRLGPEIVIGIVPRPSLGGRSHGVVVRGSREQPRDHDLVFGRRRGIGDGTGETSWGRAVGDVALEGEGGPPPHHDAAGRAVVEIGRSRQWGDSGSRLQIQVEADVGAGGIRLVDLDGQNIVACDEKRGGYPLLVEIGLALGIELDKPERARKVRNEFIG